MDKKRVMALGMVTALCAAAVFSFSGCQILDNLTVDYEAWSRQIAEKTLTSVVKIKKHESQLSGYEDSLGSGVIIHKKGNMAYALTNHHVVEKKHTGWSVSYTVTDGFDGEHTLTGVEYKDASYDLALLSFSMYTTSSPNEIKNDLAVTSLAYTNVATHAAIAHVSCPGGRHNATTFGKVLRYEPVTLTGETAGEGVTFPVMAHNAFSLGGSSGGLVLNYDMKLVGIEFACGYTQDDEFVEGYAIPVEKVREFLLAAELATGEDYGV